MSSGKENKKRFKIKRFVSFLFVLAGRFKLRLRSRKRDRRIIRQAKAADTWDRLNVLGGRALELRAWQQYRLKRRPGETDACLRQRITNAIANEYKEKIRKEIADTFHLPLEVIKAEKTGERTDNE